MVAEPGTPEERLLRMIEGPQGPATGKPAAPPRASGLAWIQERWRRLSPLRFQRLAPAYGGKPQTDALLGNLRLANRLLVLLLAGLGVYLVMAVLVMTPKPKQWTATTSQGGVIAAAPGSAALKPLAYYVGLIQSRNPFTGGAEAVAPQMVTESIRQKLEKMVASLKVVGISPGAKPEALLEDDEAQRTYFVKVGDDIHGVKVKQITTEGVTVTYEGEELVLR
ncbi:MAG: hypothetical protein HY597_03140 [Candidatus Omnitrophica bacterium]|nr:hypothetical protein [Candidatus Omnitrophota bacterium]